jgi:hypothetical protein
MYATKTLSQASFSIEIRGSQRDVVYEPKRGRRRGCGVSAYEYSCALEAQINVGDITPTIFNI